MTGVQRYTHEVTSRLKIPWEGISPGRSLGHIGGPLWDQTVLLSRASRGILWSPANTGPILHRRHILTVHDLSVLKQEDWFSSYFRTYYSQIIPILIKNALYIITDSQFIRSEILTLFPVKEELVQVCPLGVSETFFVKPNPNKTKPYILAVGSIDPRKNLQRLLQAWMQVQTRFPEFELRIVGGGTPVFRKINFISFESSNIRFLNNISDAELLEQYQSATAFVYPSLYEGFGLPVLEAMAAGLPVLTSNHSSMSEITGNSAILVDPRSEESIGAGIIKLIESEDLRSSLAVSGKGIAKKFTWHHTADLISNILSRHIID
jgi:glycosyltransferase involved in cell wall biosynthesis